MNKQIKSIQILGSGCPTCKKLLELTKLAVTELNLNIEVEYITDIQKIIKMGMMSSPVLAINGQPVMGGFTSDIEIIKKFIIDSDASNSIELEPEPRCACGGNC